MAPQQFELGFRTPGTAPRVNSAKQRAIVAYLKEHATITLDQAAALVGRDVYASQHKHTGALLANMVRRGYVVRTARGVFALPCPPHRWQPSATSGAPA